MENKDWKNLILSIGKFHIRTRTPMEVAFLIKKAIKAGFTKNEIAERCHLKGTTMLGKFLNLLKIPEDYWGFVDWSGDSGTISFTSAQMVAQHDIGIQKLMLDAILKYDFNKDEVAFLGQRIKRSGKSPEEAIQESVNRRQGPPILFGIILGNLDPLSVQKLQDSSQYEKNDVLTNYVKQKLKHDLIKIKYKNNGYALIVSDKELYNNLSLNKEQIEQDINEFICQTK